MLKKTLGVPWTARRLNQSILKQIEPVHPKRDQCWVFIGRTDARAETPIPWPPHVESWLIGKHPDAGKDWGQEKKGRTEDEMAGWHHRLEGHEFEWTPGVGDGQGGLACCDSWGLKESDTTERLSWTELRATSVSKTQVLLLQNHWSQYFKILSLTCACPTSSCPLTISREIDYL